MGNQTTKQKIIYCKCGNTKRKDKLDTWNLFKVGDEFVCKKCYIKFENKKALDLLQMYKK